MLNKDFFGETKNVEFKREIPSKHEKFLKDIIAFSNSTGGQVILGIYAYRIHYSRMNTYHPTGLPHVSMLQIQAQNLLMRTNNHK